MIISIRNIHIIIVAASLSLISGCGNDREDLDRYLNEVKSRPPKQIEPIPEYTPLLKFEYPENVVRRSPFKPVEPEQVDDVAAPDIHRKKQPLEAFPLDALKFVGILKQDHTIWALIAQPDNRITRIKAGEYIGQNFGRVQRITEDTVKIEETVRVGGKWEKKMTQLQLNSQN